MAPPLGLHQTKISPGLAFLGAKTKPAKILPFDLFKPQVQVETNKITGVVIWLLLHSHFKGLQDIMTHVSILQPTIKIEVA